MNPADWVNSIKGVKATDQFIALDRRLFEDCISRAYAAATKLAYPAAPVQAEAPSPSNVPETGSIFRDHPAMGFKGLSLASLPTTEASGAGEREAIARALYLRRNPSPYSGNDEYQWRIAQGLDLSDYYADADAILALATPHPSAPGEGMREIADVASVLSAKLHMIHDDPAYQSVWTINQLHAGQYRGPTYTDELARLDDALRAAALAAGGSR